MVIGWDRKSLAFPANRRGRASNKGEYLPETVLPFQFSHDDRFFLNREIVVLFSHHNPLYGWCCTCELEISEDNRLRLYNLTKDPSESRDLSVNLPDKSTQMVKQLNRYLAEVNARPPHLNPNYNPNKDIFREKWSEKRNKNRKKTRR